MGFLVPQVPSIPTPTPPPTPVPVEQIQQQQLSEEALTRKKMGKQATLLTGGQGDTSGASTSKTLLGQ